jgi:hypothetical protein
MSTEEMWQWEFLGFESVAEGQPVQAWFNSLPDEAKDEIVDLVQHLRTATSTLWRRPEFDPLQGEGGISELRPANVRTEQGTATYRIYGFRGNRVYVLLHGNRKGVANDRQGKQIGRRRLAELQRREATTHKFDFEGKHNT